MATIVETLQELQTDERFVIRGVPWGVYQSIVQALGDNRVRTAFDGMNLEFMSPSPTHELYAEMLGNLLVALAVDRRLRMRSGGSMRFQRQELERGLEPDKCYWIQSESAVRGKADIDLAVDSPPDLAIEIEMSRSALNRMSIYSRLGVPEVWRFDGEALRVHLLQTDGTYSESSASLCLPRLPVQIMARYLQPDDPTDDISRVCAFVDWARLFFKTNAE